MVGDAVTSNTGTVPVSLNPIEYYIPIADAQAVDGTFGVGGYGQSSSQTGSGPFVNANGKLLDMWLYFDGNVAGASQADLHLWFRDLDLDGVNDPDSSRLTLVEQVQLFDVNDMAIGSAITDSTDSRVAFADHDSQHISIDLTLAGVTVPEEFWLKLQFQSTVDYAGTGKLTNTAEKVIAKLVTVPIPEPATYALLGSGLATAALARRKRPLASL